jgi:sugar phosphate isomerase/epimerase
MYPSLPRPYKGQFPFRLGTTSFIHPDHIVPNVEALGPYLDEIEITIFESDPASLPPPSDIAALSERSRRDGLRYNIHLPLDIAITAADEAEGIAAVSALRGVIDLTRSLDPTTWTLHLPYPEPDRSANSRKIWQERTLRRLDDFFSGNPAPPESLSLENLDYPPEWLDPFIDRFGCAVCLDIGHLITNGYDWERAFTDYLPLTSVVHLSGMEGGKDHKSLHLLPQADGRRLASLLRNYTGSVMLEIFSHSDLLSSLDYFERIWRENQEEAAS